MRLNRLPFFKNKFSPILIVLVLFITGCAPDVQVPTEVPVTRIIESYSLPSLSSSEEEIIARADPIVIGRPIQQVAVINGRRDEQDANKPSQTDFSLGDVYEFQVDEYLKGEGPKKIYINISGGKVPNAKSWEDALAKQDEASSLGDYPLNPQERYLLFLQLTLDPYPELDPNYKPLYYGSTLDPWMFVIADTGETSYRIPGDLYGAPGGDLVIHTLDLWKEKIKNPDLALPTRTPQPSNSPYPGPDENAAPSVDQQNVDHQPPYPYP